jgi:hypothetical protein
MHAANTLAKYTHLSLATVPLKASVKIRLIGIAVYIYIYFETFVSHLINNKYIYIMINYKSFLQKNICWFTDVYHSFIGGHWIWVRIKHVTVCNPNPCGPRLWNKNFSLSGLVCFTVEATSLDWKISVFGKSQCFAMPC